MHRSGVSQLETVRFAIGVHLRANPQSRYNSICFAGTCADIEGAHAALNVAVRPEIARDVSQVV